MPRIELEVVGRRPIDQRPHGGCDDRDHLDSNGNQPCLTETPSRASAAGENPQDGSREEQSEEGCTGQRRLRSLLLVPVLPQPTSRGAPVRSRSTCQPIEGSPSSNHPSVYARTGAPSTNPPSFPTVLIRQSSRAVRLTHAELVSVCVNLLEFPCAQCSESPAEQPKRRSDNRQAHCDCRDGEPDRPR